MKTVFKEWWAYLKSLRLMLVVSVGVFLMAVVLAFTNGMVHADDNKVIVDELRTYYVDAGWSNQTAPEQTWGIFSGNVPKAFLYNALGGAVVFPCVYSLLINGVTLGILLAYMCSEAGVAVGIIAIVIAVLPHGIIEYPAFFVSAAVGLKFADSLIRWVRLGALAGLPPLLNDLKYGALTMFLLVVPAFAVAALIEGFVTPAIINFITGLA